MLWRFSIYHVDYIALWWYTCISTTEFGVASYIEAKMACIRKS